MLKAHQALLVAQYGTLAADINIALDKIDSPKLIDIVANIRAGSSGSSSTRDSGGTQTSNVTVNPDGSITYSESFSGDEGGPAASSSQPLYADATGNVFMDKAHNNPAGNDAQEAFDKLAGSINDATDASDSLDNELTGNTLVDSLEYAERATRAWEKALDDLPMPPQGGNGLSGSPSSSVPIDATALLEEAIATGPAGLPLDPNEAFNNAIKTGPAGLPLDPNEAFNNLIKTAPAGLPFDPNEAFANAIANAKATGPAGLPLDPNEAFPAAAGGIFLPRPGGHLVNLAEGGQPEAVLNPSQLAEAMGVGAGGGEITIINRLTIGDYTLADLVTRGRSEAEREGIWD